MFKKIDIFYRGQYMCSTNSSRTCKIAKLKWIASRYPKSIIIDHVKARFSK